jgi:hypothetical protein
MIFGPNLVQKRNEIDPHPPSNRLPIQSDSPEFGGLGTLIAIGRDCSNGGDASINERENKVARCHLFHEFIEWVSRSVGISLRRPEITAFDLLPIRLVLVYPPVAHGVFTLPERCKRIMASCQFVVELDMTLDDFRQSLTAAEPPAGLTLALAGLWWDAKGDWTRAHESAQRDEGKDGSWVHAYLHRKEGDQGNAAYWYRRAGKPVCREPLETEWLSIVEVLLR